MVALVNNLTDGKIGDIPISEESNSLEEPENPTIDTGQDENINGVNGEVLYSERNKNVPSLQHIVDPDEEDEEEDEEEDGDDEEEEDEEEEEEDEEEEEEEGEDNEEQDESEEEESAEENGTQEVEKQKKINIEPVSHVPIEKVASPVQPILKVEAKDTNSLKNGVPTVQETPEIKSIETPVITTSPLKLVNINELRHSPEKKQNEILSKFFDYCYS